jgi:hypothetical protein
VKVLCFLKERAGNSTIVAKGESDVEEVNNQPSFGHNPLESVPAVKASTKLGPEDFVLFEVRVAGPDAENVVDVTAVVDEAVRKFVQVDFFMGSKTQRGVAGPRWGAHGGSSELMPEGISKLKNITCHDNFNCSNKSVERDDGEQERVVLDVGEDCVEGRWGVNVGIH